MHIASGDLCDLQQFHATKGTPWPPTKSHRECKHRRRDQGTNLSSPEQCNDHLPPAGPCGRKNPVLLVGTQCGSMY